MSITKNSTRIEEAQAIVDRVALDLGECPVPHSRRGDQWRPRTMAATWRRNRVNGGDWSPWQLSVTVSGPKVKRDGTDSQVTHDARVWSAAGLTERELPATLILWIQGAAPDSGDDLPAPYRRPVDDEGQPAQPVGTLDLDLV